MNNIPIVDSLERGYPTASAILECIAAHRPHYGIEFTDHRVRQQKRSGAQTVVFKVKREYLTSVLQDIEDIAGTCFSFKDRRRNGGSAPKGGHETQRYCCSFSKRPKSRASMAGIKGDPLLSSSGKPLACPAQFSCRLHDKKPDIANVWWTCEHWNHGVGDGAHLGTRRMHDDVKKWCTDLIDAGHTPEEVFQWSIDPDSRPADIPAKPIGDLVPQTQRHERNLKWYPTMQFLQTRARMSSRASRDRRASKPRLRESTVSSASRRSRTSRGASTVDAASMHHDEPAVAAAVAAAAAEMGIENAPENVGGITSASALSDAALLIKTPMTSCSRLLTSPMSAASMTSLSTLPSPADLMSVDLLNAEMLPAAAAASATSPQGMPPSPPPAPELYETPRRRRDSAVSTGKGRGITATLPLAVGTTPRGRGSAVSVGLGDIAFQSPYKHLNEVTSTPTKTLQDVADRYMNQLGQPWFVPPSIQGINLGEATSFAAVSPLRFQTPQRSRPSDSDLSVRSSVKRRRILQRGDAMMPQPSPPPSLVHMTAALTPLQSSPGRYLYPTSSPMQHTSLLWPGFASPMPR